MSGRISRRRSARSQIAAGRTYLSIAITALAVFAQPTLNARAETVPTAQARNDNGVFLTSTPPPNIKAGMCLVDTGVNLNPDTEGVVVDRTALDGGSGNDVSPTMHGTVMAMMAAAPQNGWGMVGTAPQALQIVSVRILEPGHTTFLFSAYAAGITACLRVHQEYDIRVINLSLGTSETPSAQEYEALGNAIERATNYGVAVVAAAGNDDGGAVEYPAAYPGVLSVGAADTQTGGFCSFSNRGAGLRMIAPGCDLDGADPTTGMPAFNYWQGTSEASAIAAASLTALYSYKPELSWQEGEAYLTAANSGALDVAQAFRNAQLENVVNAGEAVRAQTTPPTDSSPTAVPPTPVQPSTTMRGTGRFIRPIMKLERRRGKTTVRFANRPTGAEIEVCYLGYRRRARRLSTLRRTTTRSLRGTVPAWAVELRSRYFDPFDVERASGWSTVVVRRTWRAHHR